MFIVSAIVSLLSKVLLLGGAVAIGLSGNQHLVHRSPFTIWCQQADVVHELVAGGKNLEACSFWNRSYPRCIQFETSEEPEQGTSLRETSNKEKRIPSPTEQNTTLPDHFVDSLGQAGFVQKVRICGTFEEEQFVFFSVSAILLFSTLASFVSSVMLYRLSDYYNLYKISNKWLWLVRTKRIIHRSLLFRTVEGEVDLQLEEILEGDNMVDYVNRPNYEGQFALHISVNRGNLKDTLLLMEKGAKQYPKKDGNLQDLKNLVRSSTQDAVEHLNKIASMVIEEASKDVTPQKLAKQKAAFLQLTSQNDQGLSLLSVLTPDVSQKIALWDQEEILKLIHRMSRDTLLWLMEETEAGRWEKKEVIFEEVNKTDISKLPDEQKHVMYSWRLHRALESIPDALREHLSTLIQQTNLSYWEKKDFYSKLQELTGIRSDEDITAFLGFLRKNKAGPLFGTQTQMHREPTPTLATWGWSPLPTTRW